MNHDEAAGERYEVRVNWWVSNVSVTCRDCGAEHRFAWSEDTHPPEDAEIETAVDLWAWIRGHVAAHVDSEIEPE